MDNAGGSPQEIVPPVEGVAGGGTAYGWKDGGLHGSNLLMGSVDPSEFPTADLLHVWCMPSTANVGHQEMPRHGRDEGLVLLEKTGVYLGPERYTMEHMPIDVMRGEIFNTCRP